LRDLPQFGLVKEGARGRGVIEGELKRTTDGGVSHALVDDGLSLREHVDGSPRYLVVKGAAGMGNRMLALLSAILYARASGRRLIVDWSDFSYSTDRSNVFHNLFVCPEAEPACEIPDTDSVNPAIWRGHLQLTANRMIGKFDPGQHSKLTIHKRYSVDLSRTDHPEQVAIMWSYVHLFRAVRPHLKGPLAPFAGLADMAIARSLLSDSLRPVPSVIDVVDSFEQRWFARRPVLGLHIRHSDRKTPLPAFDRVIRRIRRRHPDCSIFLATDNRHVLEEIEEKHGAVVSTPKWYPENGAKMHENHACSDRLQTGIEALIDMYLLARCDYLVFSSRSTFSVISSLLTEAPASNVIDVERWNVALRAKRAIRARIA
jgi:hypothetical protein